MANIVIRYDNTNITSRVIFNSARFSGQMAAQPGTFEFTCKDPQRNQNYVTGKEITLDVDGERLFAGYLTMVTRTFGLPVDIVPSDARVWVLRGVDYNILFDKRVIRNTSNYTEAISLGTTLRFDGDVIRTMCANYLDIPAGLNTSTHVYNITHANPGGTEFVYQTQGTTWREAMDRHLELSNGLYYIRPDKTLHYVPVELSTAPWGFSDTPNKTTSIGPRDVTATEDASAMVNDALVWGGATELTGWDGAVEGAGAVVFARHQNAASQSTHGRWQHGEARWGEQTYYDQAAVDQRARSIIDGPPGTDLEETRGLKHPQWQIKATWYSKDVPSNTHLWPGQLVTFNLSTFGSALNPIVLPLRSVDISFPAKTDAVNVADVMFTGTFGVQFSDPFSIWAYMKKLRYRKRTASGLIPVYDDSATSTIYGGLGQFTPVPAPDGVTTDFGIPVGGYIQDTLQVYFNGLLLPSQGYTVAQLSPVAGTFRITPAPPTGTWLHVVCRTLKG
jgi:hypothetical protein